MRRYLQAVLPAVLVGCAVPKVPVPIGGSRADGTIVMGCQYGLFEIPQVNWEQARINAGYRRHRRQRLHRTASDHDIRPEGHEGHAIWSGV